MPPISKSESWSSTFAGAALVATIEGAALPDVVGKRKAAGRADSGCDPRESEAAGGDPRGAGGGWLSRRQRRPRPRAGLRARGRACRWRRCRPRGWQRAASTEGAGGSGAAARRSARARPGGRARWRGRGGRRRSACGRRRFRRAACPPAIRLSSSRLTSPVTLTRKSASVNRALATQAAKKTFLSQPPSPRRIIRSTTTAKAKNTSPLPSPTTSENRFPLAIPSVIHTSGKSTASARAWASQLRQPGHRPVRRASRTSRTTAQAVTTTSRKMRPVRPPGARAQWPLAPARASSNRATASASRMFTTVSSTNETTSPIQRTASSGCEFAQTRSAASPRMQIATAPRRRRSRRRPGAAARGRRARRAPARARSRPGGPRFPRHDLTGRHDGVRLKPRAGRAIGCSRGGERGVRTALAGVAAVSRLAITASVLGTSLITARWLGPQGRGEYSVSVLLAAILVIAVDLVGPGAMYFSARATSEAQTREHGRRRQCDRSRDGPRLSRAPPSSREPRR